LRMDCLACLRNMCIDEHACLVITSMGAPSLLNIFATAPAVSNLHSTTLSVLRNLAVQNR
jgi:hypothetical protein